MVNVKNSMQQKIINFADLYLKYLKDATGKEKMTVDDKTSLEELYEDILSDLLQSPGTLIYFENNAEKELAQLVVDLLYNNLNTDEMFEKLTGGGYKGLLVNIVADYIDRAKIIKPTFISINPENKEFKYYFEEAMRAWLYGADTASLILCASLLEDLLKSKLEKIDIDLAYKLKKRNGEIIGVKSVELKILINNALREGILDNEHHEKAHQIRNLRNDAVHELKSRNYHEVYKAIINTKIITEKIMSK